MAKQPIPIEATLEALYEAFQNGPHTGFCPPDHAHQEVCDHLVAQGYLRPLPGEAYAPTREGAIFLVCAGLIFPGDAFAFFAEEGGW